MKIKVPKFTEKEGFFTTRERSDHMRKIRSTQTEPEKALRKALWSKGFRYRINIKKLPGSPDIVFRKKELVIFVDGEFWHGYKWMQKKKKIKTNRIYWIAKIERNMQRDKENNKALRAMGYFILRFWQHEIKNDLAKCVAKISNKIQKAKV